MSRVSAGSGAGSRRLAARLFGIPLRWLGLSAGAATLAVSGFFGGLEGPDEPAIPVVQPGTVDRGSPWNVTVSRVRLVNDLGTLRLTVPGDRWLAVVATVEVTADESRNDLDDVLRLTGVLGLMSQEPAHVMLMRDATELGRLNPGMPEEIAFVWEQSAGAAPPGTVTVQIYGKTYRMDNLANRMEWLDPAVRAEVVAPVQDRRAG
ncbi:hypothetical protein AB0J86_00410 [Micromonospora sp. NPDC049559]|uniref:hypothetical protein n=1 Tax=Micromonospora sp. NPDC049559 TaxID=3155923 RepID=UPI00343DC60B